MRAALVLLQALLCLTMLTSSQAEEPYDPRKPPPLQEVRSLVKEVKKEWKKADDSARMALLDRLAEVNHRLTLELLVSCCGKAPRHLCLHGISLLSYWDTSILEQELPALLRARAGDPPTHRACIQAAMDQQVHGCLDQIRSLARARVPPGGNAADEEAALTRTLCLKALGVIQEAASLPVLVEVMEQYAGLEGAHVEHGASGDMSWSRFYVPARTSFCAITRSGVATAAEAQAWLRAHPDFRVQEDGTTGVR